MVKKQTVIRGAVLGGLFFVVALVMAFPSVTKWRTAIPGDYGDAFFSQWLLRWDVRGLLTSGQSVFHPNMFFPFHNTLVYSDTELAVAPVAGVLGPLFGWTVAYNLIYVATWVVSQVATYALARWLKASRAGAVLAAFVFSFASVRLGHHGHFPMLFACLAPLVVLLLLWTLEERKWWQAVAFGVASAAIFLNAGYIAVVLFPLVGVVVAGWLIAERFRCGWRLYACLALAGVVCLAILLPVLRVYKEEGSFLSRPYVQNQVVTPKNFLTPAVGSLLYGGLERTFQSEFENKLFPGFVAVAVGIVGALALIRRRPRTDAAPPPDTPPPDNPDRLRRRALLLVLLGTLPALILAFGKYQFVFGHKVPLPFTIVGHIPGFRSIRAFGRFTTIPILGLAVLVAVGYDRLVKHRPDTVKIAVAAVLAVALLAEYKVRIGVTPVVTSAELTAVNHALARLPDGPVVELPMGDTRTPYWGYVEAPRLSLTPIDWHPRINGYSGYSPPDYEVSIDQFNGLAKGGPASPAALKQLDDLQVRYIVIRTKSVDPDLTGPGIGFFDQAAADRVVASLPPERVVDVSREGAALLVRLRPPATTPSSTP